MRQLLGLTANPPCTQHGATHNGGKVLEMERVDKKSAQPSKSQASPISSFCCLCCIFEIERRGFVKKSPTACSLAVGCKPYRGEPSRPPGTAHILALGGSYVRQLLGLTANPPCTQHRATHNGGKILEMKKVNQNPHSHQKAKLRQFRLFAVCAVSLK